MITNVSYPGLLSEGEEVYGNVAGVVRATPDIDITYDLIDPVLIVEMTSLKKLESEMTIGAWAQRGNIRICLKTIP